MGCSKLMHIPETLFLCIFNRIRGEVCIEVRNLGEKPSCHHGCRHKV